MADETNIDNNCSTVITVTVQNNPATGAPTISGEATSGSHLTASTAGIADSDGLANVSYAYQWLVKDQSSDDEGSEISGATSSTYKVTRDDEKKYIQVRVDFTDDAGNMESLTSEITRRVKIGGL